MNTVLNCPVRLHLFRLDPVGQSYFPVLYNRERQELHTHMPGAEQTSLFTQAALTIFLSER